MCMYDSVSHSVMYNIDRLYNLSFNCACMIVYMLLCKTVRVSHGNSRFLMASQGIPGYLKVRVRVLGTDY